MFIKLHTNKSTTIRVNVNHIVSYSLSSDIYKNSTSIKLINGDQVLVMETSEQIDDALFPSKPESKKEEVKQQENTKDQSYLYDYGQY